MERSGVLWSVAVRPYVPQCGLAREQKNPWIPGAENQHRRFAYSENRIIIFNTERIKLLCGRSKAFQMREYHCRLMNLSTSQHTLPRISYRCHTRPSLLIPSQDSLISGWLGLGYTGFPPVRLHTLGWAHNWNCFNGRGVIGRAVKNFRFSVGKNRQCRTEWPLEYPAIYLL